MNAIEVQTAQNVSIKYDVANVGDRILAALIDYAIIAGYVISLFVVNNILAIKLTDIIGLALILILLPYVFYDLVFEIVLSGQSPGKRIMKIKVVKMNGTPPDFGSYLLRWVFRLMDIVFFTGSVALITILINGKGQRLGDIAAGTTVIKLKPLMSIEDTIFENIDQDYDTIFPEVKNADDTLMDIITDVISHYNKNSKRESAIKLMDKTKVKVEKYLNIKSSLSSREFLTTILRDYNHINGKV